MTQAMLATGTIEDGVITINTLPEEYDQMWFEVGADAAAEGMSEAALEFMVGEDGGCWTSALAGFQSITPVIERAGADDYIRAMFEDGRIMDVDLDQIYDARDEANFQRYGGWGS